MKIFHTADLHIGMKFNNYPEPIRSQLKQARLDVLGKMVSIANQQECNIFVVAGDLFDNINGNSKKVIGDVVTALKGFHGECVLVLPGNHDYDNNMVELWKNFRELSQDIHNMVFINQESPIYLTDFDLNAVVYPAPCHSKHSDVNNIGWIRNENIESDKDKNIVKGKDQAPIRIGVAHGALEGISPDLDSSYYNMSLAELEAAPVDVWLLGHTHLTYPIMNSNTNSITDPDKKTVTGWKVFNPGTPEPDGLDCKHTGNAWIITINDIKALNSDIKALNSDTKALNGNYIEVSGELVETGRYRFVDQSHKVSSREDLDRIGGALLGSQSEDTSGKIAGSHPGGILKNEPRFTIGRLRLRGKLEEEAFNYRHEVRRKLEEALGYLIFDDTEVGIKITGEMIHKEFSDGSFPEKLLSALSEDEEALQLAYELILEVKR